MGVSGDAHLQGEQTPSGSRHQPLPAGPVAATHRAPSEQLHVGPDEPGQSPSVQGSTPQVPTKSAALLSQCAGRPPMHVCPEGQSASPNQPVGGGCRQVPGLSFAQSAE
jgi:hypothetical protein